MEAVSRYMMLSPHFSLEEFTISQTAVRMDIDNVPDLRSIFNLRRLCINLLEPLRAIIDSPILITSGYRSFRLNEAVGGSKFSQHCYGMAADIYVQNMLAEELFKTIIINELPYDKLILEFKSWVHVSYSKSRNRSIKLIAIRDTNNQVEYRSV